MVSQGRLVVVGAQNDLLSISIAAVLRARGHVVVHVPPASVGDLLVTLDGDTFYIDGEVVDGVVFRTSPFSSFSDSFGDSDRAFVDAESSALWVAALNLASVFAVNKYKARAWFEGAGWIHWRAKLIAAGIRVSRFSFGDTRDIHGSAAWYPFLSSTRRPFPGRTVTRVLGAAVSEATPRNSSLVAYNQIVWGQSHPSIGEVAAFLELEGISFFLLDTDQDGAILSVNTIPVVSEPTTVDHLSKLISSKFDAHMHSR